MSNRSATIALLTDFGLFDPYVGQMKGVMRRIAPVAEIIDLTHLVPPQSIMLASVFLEQSVKSFPENTVFLCVVDPGVGTDRRALAAYCDGKYFVGPDNGVFSFVLSPGARVHEIENPELAMPAVSTTFHGRDIFAPAAAHLVNGVELEKFGPPVDEVIRLKWPHPQKIRDGEWRIPVIAADHFGNLITGLRPETLRELDIRDLTLIVDQHSIGTISPTFGAVGSGQWLAYWGSGGLLEVAINGGSASAVSGLGAGDFIVMKDLSLAQNGKGGMWR